MHGDCLQEMGLGAQETSVNIHIFMIEMEQT